jgi:hypothetical protein
MGRVILPMDQRSREPWRASRVASNPSPVSRRRALTTEHRKDDHQARSYNRPKRAPLRLAFSCAAVAALPTRLSSSACSTTSSRRRPLEAGRVTAPIQLGDDIIIVQLVERQPSRDRSDEEARPERLRRPHGAAIQATK